MSIWNRLVPMPIGTLINYERVIITMRLFAEDPVSKVTRCVVPLAEKYGVLRVSLFGSRARGDFRRDSDYDLLVLYPSDMPFYMKTRFVTEVIHALGEDVDIIREDCIMPEFYNSISGDLREIYAAV